MHPLFIKIINLVPKNLGKKVVIDVDLRYSKFYFKYCSVICNFLTWFACLFTVQILIHFICNGTPKIPSVSVWEIWPCMLTIHPSWQFSTFSLCLLKMYWRCNEKLCINQGQKHFLRQTNQNVPRLEILVNITNIVNGFESFGHIKCYVHSHE